MTDQQALPPRRSLTAGRELPPRVGEAPEVAPAPAPRASRQGIEHRPVAARTVNPERRPTSRPDPRPMRIVYGAGAVAAMSVMAVGLVQPDWTATADQGPTDGSWPAGAESGAVAALPGGKSEASQPDPTAGKGEGARVNVRHVIRYVYLRPGQTAPPGATVVSATAAPPRAARNHPSNPGPTVSPRPRQNNGGGNNNGGPVSATPRPTPRATQAPAATPQPTPRPTPKSRQSGKP